MVTKKVTHLIRVDSDTKAMLDSQRKNLSYNMFLMEQVRQLNMLKLSVLCSRVLSSIDKSSFMLSSAMDDLNRYYDTIKPNKR